ncbi:MAG: CoA transferase [Burkholderiales bacterium]|nr:CoA transferase [Burkholderiales bacterium]
MRVLELAQIMAGPTCGIMLADLGADVIKVEKLPGGDDARGYREPRVNGVSAPFMMMNRGKRGIALDLKQPQGREILLRLTRNADVLVENYRRDTLEKLGLGYEVLAARTRDEWIAALDAAGVPAGPVHALGEALTHPHTLARGMVVDLVHPEAGATKAIGCPLHFSATPARVDRPAPLLGEHTREVLRECGYGDAEIDAYVAAGVVADGKDGGPGPDSVSSAPP